MNPLHILNIDFGEEFDTEGVEGISDQDKEQLEKLRAEFQALASAGVLRNLATTKSEPAARREKEAANDLAEESMPQGLPDRGPGSEELAPRRQTGQSQASSSTPSLPTVPKKSTEIEAKHRT